MRSQIEARTSDWQDRVDIPLRMQRPMGAVFGIMALSCVVVLAIVLAVLIAQLKRGHSVDITYFAAAIPVLVIGCVVFGRFGIRLLKKRENQIGRASGRSLPSGRYFTYSFLIFVLGVFLAEQFLTGAMLYISLAVLSLGIGSLVVGVPREQPMHNQSPDPTLPRSRLLRGRRRAPR
jgi:hypothetical protein